MGTSTVRPLTDDELARLPMARAAMEAAGRGNAAGRFNFFAAFDGTRNDKDNLKRSGDPYPTNVGRLFDQAERRKSATFAPKYYPGVGTGGDQGELGRAAFWPTPAIDAAAEKAYGDFVEASRRYLNSHPGATPADLSASVTGFSRGCATAVRFAQRLNAQGLVSPDGAVIAPPGSVPVTAMALMDPVATGVQGELGIPPNVRGRVLVVQGQHEHRDLFRPLDYRGDPRVVAVQHPGNHVGVGGGYDRHGTAANVLEGLTGYFQASGLPLANVPPELRHDPGQRPLLRTEAYQTARNGEVTTDELGKPHLQWSEDDPSRPRVEVRPRVSPAHQAWLQQAYAALAPGLQAEGMSPAQCLQVSAACVASAATHGDWGDPRRFLLSKDRAAAAVQHENGRFEELRVDEALQHSADAHLERAQQAQTTMRASPPEHVAPARAEAVIAR